MIQRPSVVAWRPFGCPPGESKTISTLPVLRTLILLRSSRAAALATGTAAAVPARNSLRRIFRRTSPSEDPWYITSPTAGGYNWKDKGRRHLQNPQNQ